MKGEITVQLQTNLIWHVTTAMHLLLMANSALDRTVLRQAPPVPLVVDLAL